MLPRIKSLTISILALAAMFTPALCQPVPAEKSAAPVQEFFVPPEILRGMNLQRVPLSQKLESIYFKAWKQVSDHYSKQEDLAKWQSWKHKYDGKLKTETDLENALAAMLASLHDPWTRYTTTAEMKAARERTARGIVESGVIPTIDEAGIIKIKSVLYGTAAYLEGLHKGDILVQIGKSDIRGKTQEDVEEMLRGQVGTVIDIAVQRKGNNKNFSLTLSKPEEDAVRYELLKDGIAYIRLDEFAPDSARQFTDALIALNQEAGGRLSGLILDLRGNPGGEVEIAKTMAELFLEKGTIFSTRTRKDRQIVHEVVDISPPSQYYYDDMPKEMASAARDYLKVPMVVLVDGSTMSASEILTGALKDNGRATIIGTTTWGKGIGMLMGQIPPGGIISVTSLDYLTPSGYNLSGRGIAPDIEVERHPGSKVDEQLERAVEFLKGK